MYFRVIAPMEIYFPKLSAGKRQVRENKKDHLSSSVNANLAKHDTDATCMVTDVKDAITVAHSQRPHLAPNRHPSPRVIVDPKGSHDPLGRARWPRPAWGT